MPRKRFYDRAKKSYRSLRTAVRHYKNALTDHTAKLLFLNYHRVLPEVGFNPVDTVVSLDTFIAQIDTLARKIPVISLDDASEQCVSGKPRNKIQSVITFDDGYLDNLEIAYPVLRKKGLIAAFFIVADYIGRNQPLWDQELVSIIMDDPKIDRLDIEGQILRQGSDRRLAFALRLLERMKSVPDSSRIRIITSLKNNLSGISVSKDNFGRSMNWDEVLRLHKQGMIIGSHSATHSSLSRLPFQVALGDIERSKRLIEEKLGNKIMHFAFPFGSRADYNQPLIDYVFKIGFKTCLLNIRGYNRVAQDNYCFKRIAMHENINLKYLLG